MSTALRSPLLRVGGVVLGAFLLALGLRLDFGARIQRSILANSLISDSAAYWDWSSFLMIPDHGPEGPYFLGPLYPHVLAVVRRLIADRVSAVIALQAVWGALAVASLTLAASRVTRLAGAAAVGVLLAGYEMLVYFDTLVLSESLLIALQSLLLLIVVMIDWKALRWRDVLALGLVIGVMAQGRATAMALALPVVLGIYAGAGRTLRAARLAAVFAGALCCCAIPSAIHNFRVTGEWIPFTYNLGYNLYIGNHPGATGSFVVIDGGLIPDPLDARDIAGGGAGDGRTHIVRLTGSHPTPGASSQWWLRAAIEHVKAHPIDAIRLTWLKLAMLGNANEYPQIESPDVFRAVAGRIGLPIVGTFAALALLFACGVAPAWRSGIRMRVVLGIVASLVVTLLPFFVTDRYRIHLVPGMAVVAACGVVRIRETLAQRQGRAALGTLAALLAAVAVLNLPTPERETGRKEWDLSVDIGERMLEKGEWGPALSHFDRALAIEASPGLRGSDTPSGRAARGRLRYLKGLASARGGRHEEARAWFTEAISLGHGRRDVQLALGHACIEAGRPEEAVLALRRTGIAAAALSAELHEEGRRLHASNETERSIRYLDVAVALDGANREAWVELVILRLRMRELELAESALDRARDADLGTERLALLRALTTAARGAPERARGLWNSVRAESLARDSSLSALSELVDALLRRSGY